MVLRDWVFKHERIVHLENYLKNPSGLAVQYVPGHIEEVKANIAELRHDCVQYEKEHGRPVHNGKDWEPCPSSR